MDRPLVDWIGFDRDSKTGLYRHVIICVCSDGLT